LLTFIAFSSIKQRDDYRTFWKDRIDSVRIWRSVDGDLETGGTDQHYTIRGLEAYVFLTSKELSHQRDLYTVTVLKEQDCERIRAKTEGWSAIALERAQNWAAQDALEVAGIEQTPAMRRSSFVAACTQNSSNRSLSPPRSPASVIVDLTAAEVECLQDVKKMNKLLIQHMQQRQQQQPTPPPTHEQTPRKKQRRNSTLDQRRNSMYHDQMPDRSSLYQQQQVHHQKQQRRNSTLDQRRNSMHGVQQRPDSSSLPQQHQAQQQQQQQQRRNSITDDYERHMSFCNQLLRNHQQLIKQYHTVGHRDSLALGVQQYYDPDHNINNNDIDTVFHYNIRRDSLSHNSLHHHHHHHQQQQQQYQQSPRQKSLAYEMQQRRDSLSMLRHSANDHYPMQDLQHQQLQPDYSDSVTSYSRLRRDSLAGHFL
jgi:hypothetical protein